MIKSEFEYEITKQLIAYFKNSVKNLKAINDQYAKDDLRVLESEIDNLKKQVVFYEKNTTDIAGKNPGGNS